MRKNGVILIETLFTIVIFSFLLIELNNFYIKSLKKINEKKQNFNTINITKLILKNIENKKDKKLKHKQIKEYMLKTTKNIEKLNFLKNKYFNYEIKFEKKINIKNTNIYFYNQYITIDNNTIIIPRIKI